MLSPHAGVVLRRHLIEPRVAGSRQSLPQSRWLKREKCAAKLRSFSSRVQPEEGYRPSYDSRKQVKTPKWPKNREEELEQLAKKVHPGAKLKKAEPGSFSFRVRADERVSAPIVENTGEPIVGLIKPPPLAQKTDPFVLKQHRNREARRQEVLALLRGETDTLTIFQVNDYYDQLRALDFEDIKDGFEPQYFSREQLASEGIVPPSASPSGISSTHSGVIAPSADKGNVEEWTMASNVLRRKFLKDLLANEAEHKSLAQSMPSSGLRLNRLRMGLDAKRPNTIRRAFGICMQTLLVAPWAVARGFLRLIAPRQKTDFWHFESAEERRLTQTQVDETLKDFETKLKELEQRRREAYAEIGKPSIAIFYARTAVLRWALFLVKLLTWYPFMAIFKTAKILGAWAYFTVYGTLDVTRRIALASAALAGGRQGKLSSAASTVWNGLAPHTWIRYHLGDPLGTLWDRDCGHSDHVLRHSKAAFDRIGYSIERGLLGFLHSNRFVGLLVLVILTFVISQAFIEPDMDFRRELERMRRNEPSL